MDLLTDLQIIQDLLDVSCRRGVAVYAVLEARGVPHFLDMCARLQIGAVHLRVRRGRAGDDAADYLGLKRHHLQEIPVEERQ